MNRIVGVLLGWLRPRTETAPPPLDARLDRPARRQVGALCWRRKGGQVEVLLVTSRETGRWVIPKGNRMQGLSDPDAAAQEAWEEAGVRGKLRPLRLGSFHYVKLLARGSARQMAVDVYALKVKDVLKDWPERKERTRQWFRPEEAAGLVDEPELRALLSEFAP